MNWRENPISCGKADDSAASNWLPRAMALSILSGGFQDERLPGGKRPTVLTLYMHATYSHLSYVWSLPEMNFPHGYVMHMTELVMYLPDFDDYVCLLSTCS